MSAMARGGMAWIALRPDGSVSSILTKYLQRSAAWQELLPAICRREAGRFHTLLRRPAWTTVRRVLGSAAAGYRRPAGAAEPAGITVSCIVHGFSACLSIPGRSGAGSPCTIPSPCLIPRICRICCSPIPARVRRAGLRCGIKRRRAGQRAACASIRSDVQQQMFARAGLRG